MKTLNFGLYSDAQLSFFSKGLESFLMQAKVNRLNVSWLQNLTFSPYEVLFPPCLGQD